MNTSSLVAHLLELRDCLMRAVLAVLLVFLALFPFANRLYTWLAAPLLAKLPAGTKMIATDVTTPFFVPIKLAMMTAFLIALPYVLWQIWRFVAPGLYAHEKRLMVFIMVASTLLFLLGMAFVYFAVLPAVFTFVISSAPEGVAVMTDIEKYLNFVTGLFLAFGAAFQVPVVVVLLARMGIVEVAQLVAARPYVFVGAFVVAAVLTPPDVISQIMMAIPIWLLYELGIWLVPFLTRAQPTEG